ncbi:MAG TPA: pyridoxal 5'-phosphate synthase glutaminase subunit PdxT [Spirochaetota bacterium]|nr:pyridoxal 5'-phosphate synthase glutaminase subunit PdxT [Spirochaetota bacterium]HPS85915.1 pyridoxal 5'-phosphate synthase glutaminase subunit PdxT [Spirochaetota bacterium]
MSKKIGVLALQGAFQKHLNMIKRIGAEGVEIRTADDLDSIDGLIIPGGESTVIAKLLIKNDIMNSVLERVKSGMGLYGTCAGMILMAKEVEESEQPLLNLMDITVKRNAYGRQKESFEASFGIKGLIDKPFTGIFIRSPKVTAYSPEIEVLAEFDGTPILVRENRLLASSFHPELTEDTRIHQLFLSMI